jgi:hypothetical protein
MDGLERCIATLVVYALSLANVYSLTAHMLAPKEHAQTRSRLLRLSRTFIFVS